MHYERTSILQLTYAMYLTMAGASANAAPTAAHAVADEPASAQLLAHFEECCIAHSDDEFVARAVRLGLDSVLRQATRAHILAHNARLYAPHTASRVLSEWEAFLRHASDSPRPDPAACAPGARALIARELGFANREARAPWQQAAVVPLVARPIEARPDESVG